MGKQILSKQEKLMQGIFDQVHFFFEKAESAEKQKVVLELRKKIAELAETVEIKVSWFSVIPREEQNQSKILEKKMLLQKILSSIYKSYIRAGELECAENQKQIVEQRDDIEKLAEIMGISVGWFTVY
ncbi:MAG: hypothetical protein V1649_02955 [Patescibacteria group bacterium]